MGVKTLARVQTLARVKMPARVKMLAPCVLGVMIKVCEVLGARGHHQDACSMCARCAECVLGHDHVI